MCLGKEKDEINALSVLKNLFIEAPLANDTGEILRVNETIAWQDLQFTVSIYRERVINQKGKATSTLRWRKQKDNQCFDSFSLLPVLKFFQIPFFPLQWILTEQWFWVALSEAHTSELIVRKVSTYWYVNGSTFTWNLWAHLCERTPFKTRVPPRQTAIVIWPAGERSERLFDIEIK